jgi:hypothetical protein
MSVSTYPSLLSASWHWQKLLKRVLDYSFALIGLVLLSPCQGAYQGMSSLQWEKIYHRFPSICKPNQLHGQFVEMSVVKLLERWFQIGGRHRSR